MVLQKDGLIFKGIKILVVDDDNYSHHYLDRVLRRNGAIVSHAYDGAEAIICAQSEYYDLIILDIVMPYKDGYQVAHEIRSFSPETILVAYTADVLRVSSEKCKKRGISLCLLKPILPSKIEEDLYELIERTNLKKSIGI